MKHNAPKYILFMAHSIYISIVLCTESEEEWLLVFYDAANLSLSLHPLSSMEQASSVIKKSHLIKMNDARKNQLIKTRCMHQASETLELVWVNWDLRDETGMWEGDVNYFYELDSLIKKRLLALQ